MTTRVPRQSRDLGSARGANSTDEGRERRLPGEFTAINSTRPRHRPGVALRPDLREHGRSGRILGFRAGKGSSRRRVGRSDRRRAGRSPTPTVAPGLSSQNCLPRLPRIRPPRFVRRRRLAPRAERAPHDPSRADGLSSPTEPGTKVRERNINSRIPHIPPGRRCVLQADGHFRPVRPGEERNHVPFHPARFPAL